MKTITITIKDDVYLHTASTSRQYDSDCSWTEILEQDWFDALIGLLNTIGYTIDSEDVKEYR